jgi:hypothetical protein
VSGSLLLGGKLGEHREQVNALGSLVYLQDAPTTQKFLVETGEAESVLPHTSCAPSSGTPLSGADGKPFLPGAPSKIAHIWSSHFPVHFYPGSRLQAAPWQPFASWWTLHLGRFWTQTHSTLCQNPPCHRHGHDSPLHFATSLWPSVVSSPPSWPSSGMAPGHQIRNTESNTPSRPHAAPSSPRHAAMIWTSCTTQKLSSEPWRKQG